MQTYFGISSYFLFMVLPLRRRQRGEEQCQQESKCRKGNESRLSNKWEGSELQTYAEGMKSRTSREVVHVIRQEITGFLGNVAPSATGGEKLKLEVELRIKLCFST